MFAERPWKGHVNYELVFGQVRSNKTQPNSRTRNSI